MGKHTEKDTAKETGSGGKEVSRAFHDARTDSGAREGKDTFTPAPDWADKSTPSGIPTVPDRDK